MRDSHRSECPISLALEIVGDRWSMLVLRDLILRRGQRYTDFLASPEGISTNILAERLARLEDCGLISKSRDPKNKRQFLYTATRKGRDLSPVLLAMVRWGLKHDPRASLPPAARRRLNEMSVSLPRKRL